MTTVDIRTDHWPHKAPIAIVENEDSLFLLADAMVDQLVGMHVAASKIASADQAPTGAMLWRITPGHVMPSSTGRGTTFGSLSLTVTHKGERIATATLGGACFASETGAAADLARNVIWRARVKR